MMTRNEFARWCAEKVRILDGATGTELIKRGMPAGVSPEAWVAEHPEAIESVQHAYADAGSELVYTATFGGNAVKLAEFGLEAQALELNKKLAEISVRAMHPRNVKVFGDISSTGRFVEPSGNWNFEEAVAVFQSQARALAAGGVDGFVIETMMDLQETRAALIGIREIFPDAPVMVTFTFEAAGRTLTGVLPEAALITMQSLGADAFGCNCSTGPDTMAKLVKTLVPYAHIPLIAKPNAGLPTLKEGRTVFSLGPEAYASYMPELLQSSVNLVGGCCGTTPDHIRLAAEKAAKFPAPHYDARGGTGWLASSRSVVKLAYNEPFTIIGERINPTGKKALQSELRNGSLSLALQYAVEQRAAGAKVLDINMGLSGIDECAMMRRCVQEVTRAVDTPLCIDSTRPEVVEAGLRIYPGRALLNSISLEKERIEKVLPIAAKYGAMLILLPLDDHGLPETSEQRKNVLDQLLKICSDYGYVKQDLAVDALIMAVSAAPNAANAALDFIRYCHYTLEINTVCGLSNVSFGLPDRARINQTFLAMAMAQGLNLAIANPMSADLCATLRAAEALNGHDLQMRRYLASATDANPTAPTAAAKKNSERLFDNICRGEASSVEADCDAAMKEENWSARELLDNTLLPAIREVGKRFETKEYFLPQLLAGASALQKAIQYLEPQLAATASQDGPREKFILATVKGDIHDIGKNIVGIMLANSGFEVIDLGKDVPAATIVERAQQESCHLIGLSALMTTTMVEMPKVIALARKQGVDADFIVGGAVVDGEFAQEIGAFYASDAMQTVKLAQTCTEKRQNK